jgi:hypothetical protein
MKDVKQLVSLTVSHLFIPTMMNFQSFCGTGNFYSPTSQLPTPLSATLPPLLQGPLVLLNWFHLCPLLLRHLDSSTAYRIFVT